MGIFSTTWADKLNNAALRNTALPAIATVYMALFSSDPGDGASLGAELVGNNYARVAVTFAPSVGGVIANSGAIVFPTASGNWNTVNYAALVDTASGAITNMMAHGPLAVPETILTGQALQFAAGSIIMQPK